MGFNYTADEAFQMGMNSRERKLDEIERRLAVVEKKLASDFRENVHGEWVPAHINSRRAWECSLCGYQPVNYDRKIMPYEKFCANCGAFMRGE